MNNTIKKLILLNLLIMSNAFCASVTSVKELLAKQSEIALVLQEYWIDENGDTRIGNKDTSILRFSFDKNLIDKMTDVQLTRFMNTALSRLTKEQQDEFKDSVKPELDTLRTIKQQLEAKKKEMENAAIHLAKELDKTPFEIMKLKEENIRNLVSRLSQDKKNTIGSKGMLSQFFTLRKEFDVVTNENSVAISRDSSNDQREEDLLTTDTE